MTYKVTAKAWVRGWELHIEGIGSTRSTGVEDAEATVRDYLELDGYDSAAAIDITFEFRGSDSTNQQWRVCFRWTPDQTVRGRLDLLAEDRRVGLSEPGCH